MPLTTHTARQKSLSFIGWAQQHTCHLCATHLFWKAQGGAPELAGKVLTSGEISVNNMLFTYYTNLFTAVAQV